MTAALAGAETVVFQGPNANATSAGAHLVLPSAAYVERDGTFTNFEGRVQRFRPAMAPLGEARPDWADPRPRRPRACRRHGCRAHRRAGGAGLRGAGRRGAGLRGHDATAALGDAGQMVKA